MASKENKMTANRGIAALAFCLMMLSGIEPVYAEATVLDPAEDASHLGEMNKFLFWTPMPRNSNWEGNSEAL